MSKNIRLEKSRLKKVANWYDPRNKRMEKILIGYRLQMLLNNLKGPSVLEMGCSTGIMTKELVKKFPTLVVLDGSPEYIEYVKKITKAKKAKFITTLFEEFNTCDKFDDIIIANALEHVENPVLILKQAKQWLRKEGKIHVMVPNAGSLHRRIGQSLSVITKLDDLSENDKKIGHRRVYDKDSLKRDIYRAGLRVIHQEGIFLKPLSHAQLAKWDKNLLDAFLNVGKLLPEYCSTIYFICKK